MIKNAKILLVTPVSPYEPIGGGVRTKYFRNALMSVGNVDTVVVDEWGPSKEENPGTEENPIIYRKAFYAHTRKLKWYFFVLFAFLVRKIDFLYASRDEILNRLGVSGRKYDFVVCRYAWLSAKLGLWKIAPLYIDIDDLPSEVFDSIERRKFSRMKGLFMSKLTKLWQTYAFSKARHCWNSNQMQTGIVRRTCKCDYLLNIPTPIPEGYDSGIPVRRQLMTVGMFSYLPNVEGVGWFLENVWSKVHAKYSDLEYVIVGRGIPKDLQEAWSKIDGVKLLGFVDDLSKVYAESLAAIVPIFSGGGTAIKTIEAIAHQRKVIATPFGARGFTEEQLKASRISLFEDADTFMRIIDDELGKSDVQRTDDKRAMLEFVKDNYTEAVFSRVVTEVVGTK